MSNKELHVNKPNVIILFDFQWTCYRRLEIQGQGLALQVEVQGFLFFKAEDLILLSSRPWTLFLFECSVQGFIEKSSTKGYFLHFF